MTRPARRAPNSPIASSCSQGSPASSTFLHPGPAGSSCSRKAGCAAFLRRATPRRGGISRTTTSCVMPGTRRAAGRGLPLRSAPSMGLGTDCSPHNLVEEMRKAAILARVAARDITAVTTADLFHAATAGGANALMRDDLGWLAPGKKADIVLVDLECPQMQPTRDPLRSFVYHAADRAVRDVFVDGEQVVSGGRVTTLDQEAAGRRPPAAPERQGR